MPTQHGFPPPIPSNAPLPWLSWTYSLIFPVALLALIVTLVVSAVAGDDPTPQPTPPNESLAAQQNPTSQASTDVADTPPGTTAPSQPTRFAQSTPAAASTPLSGGSNEGVVTDTSGAPVTGAIVGNGTQFVVTGSDGVFQIDSPASDAQLSIQAAGYQAVSVTPNTDGEGLAVALERQQINALYFNPNFSYDDESIQTYIDMINSTSANAVVIDIKEEVVYFDSQVQLFVDAGTVQPTMDLPALIKRFEDEGIYTIARLVVFKDGLVAQHDPSLGVLNNQTGDLWRDNNGVAWVNPMVHVLWDANVELAVEAAGFGFDEIQYDYIRFPTDGDFSTMDFGLENTQENRENAINGFLDQSRAALAPLGVRQSADVFGYSLVVDNDNGIGQNYPEVAARVDYISPMIYPSHWPEGTLNVPGHSNDFPYDTVRISMVLSAQKGVDPLKVRPWLQDFSFPGMMEYGDQEVADQIRAAEEAGASGWLLWDPDNRFSPGGIPVEETIPTPATPVAQLPELVLAQGRNLALVGTRKAGGWLRPSL
ncbi:MAG TPA: putative glycoside hydrolase [Thermomicrobiales bacterium]|nr:putative glycoside hydrolase [Thermomicrobiales bacterium]